MLDYNIEFAHIYLDQEFSEEQRNSIPIAKKLIEKLKSKNETYSLGIMIDDFSPINIILDSKSYIEALRMEIDFDYVAYESQLSMYSFKFISELPSELISIKSINNINVKTFHKKDLNIGLITKDNKPSCSLLVAIWYLSRLGVYGMPAKTQLQNSKEFIAKKIITILPEKYKETEEKVLVLIANTKYNIYLDRIEYIYY